MFCRAMSAGPVGTDGEWCIRGFGMMFLSIVRGLADVFGLCASFSVQVCYRKKPATSKLGRSGDREVEGKDDMCVEVYTRIPCVKHGQGPWTSVSSVKRNRRRASKLLEGWSEE